MFPLLSTSIVCLVLPYYVIGSVASLPCFSLTHNEHLTIFYIIDASLNEIISGRQLSLPLSIQEHFKIMQDIFNVNIDQYMLLVYPQLNALGCLQLHRCLLIYHYSLVTLNYQNTVREIGNQLVISSSELGIFHC